MTPQKHFSDHLKETRPEEHPGPLLWENIALLSVAMVTSSTHIHSILCQGSTLAPFSGRTVLMYLKVQAVHVIAQCSQCCPVTRLFLVK